MMDAGVSGRSSLLDIKLLDFCRASPYGMIHLIEGVIKILYKLWRGRFDFDSEPELDIGDYVLSEPEWALIGREMRDSQSHLPEALGGAPRDVHLMHSGFRAVEWFNWLLLYVQPLLLGRLPDRYLDNVGHLLTACRLMCKYNLTKNEILTIEEELATFVEGFEDLYRFFNDDVWRLKVMTSNIHGLLHVGQQISDNGPIFTSWELPLKRYLGIIKPGAKSKVYIDASLVKET
jgi:hypothetical protein